MSEFETLPEFELGNCIDCPTAIHLLSSYEQAVAISNAVAESAIGAPLDEAGQAIFGQIESFGDGVRFNGPEGVEAIDSPEAVTSVLRRMLTSTVEQQDEDVSEMKRELSSLLERCDKGPLKLRAQRDGTQVIVTLCMSQFNEVGEHCEDVHIRRTRSTY